MRDYYLGRGKDSGKDVDEGLLKMLESGFFGSSRCIGLSTSPSDILIIQ